MRATVAAAVLLVGYGAGPRIAPQAAGSADSTRALSRERIVALRDTVQAVSRAIVVLRRDLPSAGPETILSKAQSLGRACRSVRAALLDQLPLFTPRQVPVHARPAADSVRVALRDLARRLEQQCEIGLDPQGPGQPADSIRAWGPYRTAELRRGVERFQVALTRFAGAMGVKLPPTGR
jgi:hypothetical protein